MTTRSLFLISVFALLAGVAHAQPAVTTDQKDIHSQYKVWSIAPIHLFESSIGTSLSYEHGIDAGGIVTYAMQGMFGLDLNRRYNSSRTSEDPVLFVMPGLKFYPTSCFGKTKYSVGPSLVIGAGQKTDYSTYYPSDRVGTRFLLGIMVNNTLNYQFGQRFYLGIDYGLGFSYIDRANGVNSGVSLLNQLALRMGYRY